MGLPFWLEIPCTEMNKVLRSKAPERFSNNFLEDSYYQNDCTFKIKFYCGTSGIKESLPESTNLRPIEPCEYNRDHLSQDDNQQYQYPLKLNLYNLEKYYECMGQGEYKINDCPSEMLYNPYISGCDWPTYHPVYNELKEYKERICSKIK